MPLPSDEHVTTKGMHVAFVLPRANGLRNFESTLAALITRGHRVTIVLEESSSGSSPIVTRLRAQGSLDIVAAPPQSASLSRLGMSVRASLDYWHYLRPQYEPAPELRRRAEKKAPRWAQQMAGLPAVVRSGLAAVLHAIERRLPIPTSLEPFLERLAPDVLLLTPLLYFESSQVWWLRAAKRLRLPSVFWVHSWDNLSSKGTFHETPSQVFLWNDAQRREAVELHGIDPRRCVVTGAGAFDHWFDMQPTMSREAFLAGLGLPPGSALVLYLCSSRFIARREEKWVGQWLRGLRGSEHERVRTAAVIIRPHPDRPDMWTDWTAEVDGVTVFPRIGENPIEDASRLRFFHSLYYADVVVGLNTTALIEAAILNKPVLSVVTPGPARFRKTLHFGHLERGVLSVAENAEEHFGQLGRVLTSREDANRTRDFVKDFVRPLGLDRSAGLQTALALEALGRD